MIARRCGVLGVLACAVAGAVAAQGPAVSLAPVECIPAHGNTLVTATISPPPMVGEARVYFRREEHGDFYYLPLDVTEEGLFWSILPLPEEGNHAGEIFAAVVDEEGHVVSGSAVQVVPVHEDCEVELEPPQEARARQLTVGETVEAQKGRTVAWWRCEGIVWRIDRLGELRDDEICSPAVVWWQQPGLMAPFVIIGGGIITIMMIDPEPERELSPARP